MEMMKLPSSDSDLNEDEIEGLVSAPSAIGNGGPSRSLSPKKNRITSNTIRKRKKILFVLACVTSVLALLGLRQSGGTAVAGGVDISSTEEKPTDDYYDHEVSVTKPKTRSDSNPSKIDSQLKESENDSGTEGGTTNDSPGNNDDQGDEGSGGVGKEAASDEDSGTTTSETSDTNDDKDAGGTLSSTDTNEKSDVKDDKTKDKDDDIPDSATDGNVKVEPDTANTHPEYQFPKEQYTTDTLPWTRPISDEEEEVLIEKWGKWHFWDGDPDSRPTEDYMAPFPNRDCPFDDFPDTAWQADAVYVNHMLDSAGELVARAKEAVYTEYGYGPREDIDHDQLKTRMEMFKLTIIDLEDPNVSQPPESLNQGGWSTRRSLAGLARRLLHAMMTNDTFTIVIGGHSAAAGHGNHFLQNYAMQMYKALKPIFDRVGVELIVRNEAQGGLGTMQHGLGSGDIYGDNVDMLIWDSSMTEKHDRYAIDLFYRQALIGGKRAPILWGGPFDLIKNMFIHADADVMMPGSGMHGIQETLDEEQVLTLPFASRYMKCPPESKDLCNHPNPNRFQAVCWVGRDDVTPSKPQNPTVSSQVGWHPGFRSHQLSGRSLAMVIMTGLQDAIGTWSEITIAEGHPLPDEHWHLTSYYDNIRTKAMNIDPSIGTCSSNSKFIPERVCNIPMHARSEFTPRANPNETSLRTIMKPTPDGYIPKVELEMEYDGPEVPNPALFPPEGEIDVPSIISNRRKLLEAEPNLPLDIPVSLKQHNLRGRGLEEIIPGKGWRLDALPGYCDGSAHAICGRVKGSDCLLSGHMDHRGGITGDCLSGWIVFNLPQVTNGVIIIKFEDWGGASAEATVDWTEVNDGEYDRRVLGGPPPFPDDFLFEWSINGKITSLNKTEYEETYRKISQRTMEVITLLDDPDMKEPEDIEVAVRIRNCGRTNSLKVTHMYWS